VYGDIASLKGITALEVLGLSGSGLFGDIGELGALTNLIYLMVTLTTDGKVYGDFSELAGLSSLQELDLPSNNFTGSVPDGLCGLSAVIILDLAANNFSGILPGCFYTSDTSIDKSQRLTDTLTSLNLAGNLDLVTPSFADVHPFLVSKYNNFATTTVAESGGLNRTSYSVRYVTTGDPVGGAESNSYMVLNRDVDNPPDGKADLNIQSQSASAYPERNIDVNGDGIADLNIGSRYLLYGSTYNTATRVIFPDSKAGWIPVGKALAPDAVSADFEVGPYPYYLVEKEGVTGKLVDSTITGVAPAAPVILPETGRNTSDPRGANYDANGDGVPDLNIVLPGAKYASVAIDYDGDGVPDLGLGVRAGRNALQSDDPAGANYIPLGADPLTDRINKVDLKGDGSGVLNVDLDGDGVADVDIDTTRSGVADLNVDTDHDGVPDLNLDLASASVSVVDQVTFTGSAVTPVVSVSLGGKVLVAGTDYRVEYLNNTNAGTATVTVIGQGNYTGSVSEQFQIAPRVEPKSFQVAALPSVAYQAKVITPAVTVADGSTVLAFGTDYTVSYADNVNVGAATVTVTGAGVYGAVQQQVQFQITPAPASSLKITTSDGYVWTGKQVKPASSTVKVTLGGVLLKAGVDYTLSYGSNKNIGKGTVKVTGKGNVSGAKSVSVKIVPKSNKVSKATSGKKQVSVSWSKVSKAQKVTKYQLRYSVKGSSKWVTKSYSAKTVKATVKKLAKGKVYQFQVRSYKTVSKVKYYSSWSALKSSKKVK
jgi:hypothetical protein